MNMMMRVLVHTGKNPNCVLKDPPNFIICLASWVLVFMHKLSLKLNKME